MVEFHDAPGKWMEADKAMEVHSVTINFFVGSIIILSRLCWLNIHTGILSDVSILKNRRKLQINEFNRKPVKLIWGDQHRKELKIPQIIINDYTGKKRRFFKVFKLTWYKCITTVSKENVRKNKWRRQWWISTTN